MKIEIELDDETVKYLEILAKHQCTMKIEMDLKSIVEQCAYNIATGVRRPGSHERAAVESMFGYFD